MRALSGLTLAELEEELSARGIPRWRARPILLWMHRRGADSFDRMTDLPLELRASLGADFSLACTRVLQRRADPDGTEKFLVGLQGGDAVEAVLIPEGVRRTACVSTQVGCPVGCVFCASGLGGYRRGLSAAEICDQVLHARAALGPAGRISSVVVMGVGEPLLNFENVAKALKIMKASWGMGIGYNRITLSTVGILGPVSSMVQRKVTPNLAISLHAPNDEIRRRVVPGLGGVRVAEIIRAGADYRRLTGKNVTVEYVLLEGVNDDRKHALELGKKLRGCRMKVNVIPCNPVEGLPWRAPSPDRVDRFVRALGGCGVPVTVRKRRGDGVSAACGQLRARRSVLEAGCSTS